MTDQSSDRALDQLRRWENAGAVWRVIARTSHTVDVALLTCSAGEEVSRLRIEDPAALAYIGDRQGSD